MGRHVHGGQHMCERGGRHRGHRDAAGLGGCRVRSACEGWGLRPGSQFRVSLPPGTPGGMPPVLFPCERAADVLGFSLQRKLRKSRPKCGIRFPFSEEDGAVAFFRFHLKLYPRAVVCYLSRNFSKSVMTSVQ